MFATFVCSLPALTLPTNRGWLRLQGMLTVFCALYTLTLGLLIWFSTLQTGKNLSHVWSGLSRDIQSLLQQRFQCCGYNDSQTPLFIADGVCPDSFIASQKQGCVGQLLNDSVSRPSPRRHAGRPHSPVPAALVPP